MASGARTVEDLVEMAGIALNAKAARLKLKVF